MSMTRRQFVSALGIAGMATGIASCASGTGADSRSTPSATTPVTPAASAGATRSFTLVAQPVSVDLGGTVVDTWAYGDSIPGTPLRAVAGDRVKVAFSNRLPTASSVHWHGLAIRNDMDGVPGVTTPETLPGETFTFDFVVPNSGTHWFHPHHGLQMDRGLYSAFIVDDPAEPGGYDHEWVVVLDDWTDGIGPSPDAILADLRAAGASSGSGGHDSMGGMMGHDGMGGMMGGTHGAGGDVSYPLYLVNGRAPTDPDTLPARPGERVRIRIVNASADTVFTVALEGHDLTVTHTDGFSVLPVVASSLRIGMGERYDVLVTLADGVFPLVAEPDGGGGVARALIRTGSGPVPPDSFRPGGLQGYPVTVDSLRAAPGTALPTDDAASVQDVLLSGSMAPYEWTINGTTYDRTTPLTIRRGQTGRLRIRNMSMMSHPLHVHGHSFQLGPAGGLGPRKDTVLVPAMGGVNADLLADNPGSWMVHCHNAYHAEAGMMTRLDYVA